MQRLYADAARAARGRLPVLILGETGVGKELVARAIHRESPRRDKPLVAVNCATFTASLLESTLFGHERGAFTGATQRSPGILERAHGGTLFLDEVGDLDTSAQVALLRAIEDQKITRLGATSEIVIDVHVIAATNCDLETMVEQGRFRGDLLFRLNGIRLDVPPLRERTDEIEPLARAFLERACRAWQLTHRELSPEAVEALQHCRWPGNVRQLRYAMERAALLATGALIMREDLPEHVTGSNPVPPASITCLQFDDELGLKRQVARYERALIEAALRRAGGNRQMAAKLLRVPLRTLFRKLRSTARAERSNPA
jgi:DNA-binding NtrC family response regulator